MYGSFSDPVKRMEIRDSQVSGVVRYSSVVPFTFERQGKNATRAQLDAAFPPRPEDPWELKTYRDPQGRYVNVQVRTRKNGTPVFKKKPVYITRLVQRRSKVKSAIGANLPPNPLFTRFVSTKIEEGSIRYAWRGTIGTVTGPIGIEAFTVSRDKVSVGLPTWFGTAPIDFFLSWHIKDPLPTGDSHSKALSNLYADAQDMKANIAVMLAEAKQTAASIVGAAKDVLEMIHSIKSGKFIKYVKGGLTKKKLSGRWLEAVYGIKPLISDIQGCIEAIREGRKPIIQDVNGRGKFVDDERVVYQTENSYCKTEIFRKVTVRTRYKARIQVLSQGAKLVNETGLDNPPAAFWEKIPWSFVVDWVYPLGNYLETRDAFTGCRYIFVTRTTSILSEIRVVRTFKTFDDGYFSWLEDKTIESTSRCFTVKREILDKVPSLDLPSFKNPISGMHIANGLALLVQKFSKH